MRLIYLAVACCLLCRFTPAFAGEWTLKPGQSFEAAVERLQPGDTLRMEAGRYVDSGRISITVRGTREKPVHIVASGDVLVTREGKDTAQNTINIEGGEWITLQGLEISSNGGDGVRLRNAAYITLENLHIHDVDVGVNLRTDMHHIVIRRNHIHHTGIRNGTGEGMYVGCNNAECIVHDVLIEGNWVHNTRQATQGDGIEIKRGSFNITVKDNVVHHTKFPCLLLYGAFGEYRNRVEGNVVWNCGDAGMQIAADVDVRNNIVIAGNDSIALSSFDHQGVTPSRLQFLHNTFIGGRPCLNISNWGDKQDMVFINNAVYCERSYYRMGGVNSVDMRGNVFFPKPPAHVPARSYRLGRGVRRDFKLDHLFDYYPSADSALINAGVAVELGLDFNAMVRGPVPDAGAYQWSGSTNPGWMVQPGFKPLAIVKP